MKLETGIIYKSKIKISETKFDYSYIIITDIDDFVTGTTYDKTFSDFHSVKGLCLLLVQILPKVPLLLFLNCFSIF